jgi:hypothetical protein
VDPADETMETIRRVNRIDERDIVISSLPLEATSFEVDVPEELASRFTFARHKSKLAGTIVAPSS